MKNQSKVRYRTFQLSRELPALVFGLRELEVRQDLEEPEVAGRATAHVVAVRIHRFRSELQDKGLCLF